MLHCIVVAIAMMSGFYANSVLLMHIDPILCIGFRYVAHSVHRTWLIQGLAMEWLILRDNLFENTGSHYAIKPLGR